MNLLTRMNLLSCVSLTVMLKILTAALKAKAKTIGPKAKAVR